MLSRVIWGLSAPCCAPEVRLHVLSAILSTFADLVAVLTAVLPGQHVTSAEGLDGPTSSIQLAIVWVCACLSGLR